MFRRTQMTAAMSQELMDELEGEVYELVDGITKRAVRSVLKECV